MPQRSAARMTVVFSRPWWLCPKVGLGLSRWKRFWLVCNAKSAT